MRHLSPEANLFEYYLGACVSPRKFVFTLHTQTQARMLSGTKNAPVVVDWEGDGVPEKVQTDATKYWKRRAQGRYFGRNRGASAKVRS